MTAGQMTVPTATGFLQVDHDGAVARVVLRRPPLNILDVAMLEDFNGALRALGAEPALRALVLAADGKAFSAGVSVEDHLPGRAAAMIDAFHGTFRLLRDLECPTIAAVQGAALGGGCELACFADFVIASETATFGQPEIRLGVFPPIAAVHFPSRIGSARTLQLLLTGDVIPAREAERIGLVDRVVAPGALDAAVDELANRFRALSAPALRLIRRAVLAARGKPFDDGLRAVERCFDEVMATHDAAEGLKAFLEKRAPAWRQR